ncbi:pertactin-like passenger domain-containing protein, partial [Yersinia aleksiciae]|uniref:pertactin-like passenger domain-containing protein n=1 Tax=Yersinia aleksiciae TaxID=263819 RepID=UPI00067AE028
MNRRNTLNTRLLPLSILISSLVSGGAMATAIPIYTKDMQRPTANQYTTAQKSGEFTRTVDAGSIYMDHGPAVNTDTILEGLFPTDQQLTPEEMIAEIKLQIEAMKASREQQIKEFEALVPQLTPEEQKQAPEYLAKFKDAFAKDLKVYEATLAYAEDQSDENKNKLNAATKDVYVAKLDIIAPGKFTPEEVDLIISASLTKDITAIPPALQQKIKVAKQAQLAADKSTQGKLANYLAQDVIAQEQKDKLDASFSDKQAKLGAQVEAKQAQEVAIKADDKAQADVLRLEVQSVLVKKTAENAQKEQEVAKTKLARLNNEKATAITAVDSSWTASTLDIENKLQDLIDDPSTDSATLDLAIKAQLAIADADAAKQSAQKATTEHDNAEKSAQAIEADFDDAKLAGMTTAAELADKTREFEEATDAVVNLSKVTNPTIDSPAFEQTIAKTEKQTVAADTVAFSNQVAGGTQEVADKGKIIGSIVTNDGSIALAIGAQAIDTQITEGTMSNNGGLDTGTVVGTEGLLILAGSSSTENAGSEGAVVAKGGRVTANANSWINNMVSEGDVTAKDGAIVNKTTINGGNLTLQARALAMGTTLNEGIFTLETDTGAIGTTVNSGVFDVQTGAEAKNTTLSNGTFKLLGTANTTIVNGGVFDVQAGATANDTTVHGGKFNLMDEAKASKLLVENGYALIAGTLQGAITLNGGTTTFNKTATVSGTIDSGKNSVITLHEGAKTQAADLNLAGNMNLIGATAVQQAAVQRSALPGSNGHPAQFAFKDVTLDGGTIDMSTNAQLTMASLAGNGNFNLAPSLYNQANAPLNVTGDAAGTFGIQLKDSGVAPTNLNLINVGGDSTARFALSDGPINLGNYKHSLVSDGKGGYKLVADTTTLTPSTAGVLAVANTMPVIFNAELSSIQNRLDKQSTSANESGVWINYLND